MLLGQWPRSIPARNVSSAWYSQVMQVAVGSCQELFFESGSMMMKDKFEWHEVANIADTSSDRPLEVIVGDTVVILVKFGKDVMAYQGLCPHQFARLSQGTIAGDSLHCPRHKASFDIHDGTCGPGWQLPALRQYRVRIKAGVVLLAYPLAVKAGQD